MVLIFASLMSNDIDHLFMCLFVCVCMCLHLEVSSCILHILNSAFYLFLLICRRYLHIPNISFSVFCFCLFCFVCCMLKIVFLSW